MNHMISKYILCDVNLHSKDFFLCSIELQIFLDGHSLSVPPTKNTCILYRIAQMGGEHMYINI